jgi:hypothetical protein
MIYSVVVSQPASKGDISWVTGTHSERAAAVEQVTAIVDQVLLHLEGELRRRGDAVTPDSLVDAYREDGDLPAIWVEGGATDPFDAWALVSERAARLLDWP